MFYCLKLFISMSIFPKQIWDDKLNDARILDYLQFQELW
uniref:Uncharacterized protein n=1 Tax=Rhizophora mucronata TaxID=61149 RepID=A0A2P2QM50_RHIMU